MNKNFQPIKTWIRINNVEVANHINEIKKRTNETYPNIINTLLFKATTQDEFNEKDKDFVSTSYENLYHQLNMNYVQGIKNRDEILYKLDDIIVALKSDNLDANKIEDEYKIFKIFYLTDNENIETEISDYLKKFKLTLLKNMNDKNIILYSIYNENNIKVLECRCKTFLFHDSEGIHNYYEDNMNEMIMKLNMKLY